MKCLENMDERELSRAMTAAAVAVERSFKERGIAKPLFCLVVFNDAKIAQYVSNCRRDDMITAMRETADRIERNQDVKR